MTDRYVFGLIDPRSYQIFYVGTLPQQVSLNEHLADTVAEAASGKTSPMHERVRAILAADFDAPRAVILQASAGEQDEDAWVRMLTEHGSQLTNTLAMAGA